MKHYAAVICLTLGLCCTIGCCKKGVNRLDVVLEGPWIVYQDSQFDSHGAKVPVLVAIAPISATSHPLAPGDIFHHHSPQLSTGDGFYIKPDYLKRSHIFCLLFDNKCAPETVQSPVNDMYPESRLLQLTPKAGPKTWQWVKAVKGTEVLAAALILPVPNSISNDGVWTMRFNGNKDEQHSIGLQLHYTNGPKNLMLRSCEESAQPSVTSCNNPVAGPGQPEPSKLDNSGTLRLQMRAPDNDNPCDWHVRYAWEQVWKILGGDFPTEYMNLEPAASIKADGTPTYIPCDKNIPDKNNPSIKYPKGEMVSSQGNTEGLLASTALPAEMPYTDFLNQFDTNIKTILDSIGGEDENDPDLRYFTALKTELDSLNPDFPRISQLTLIGKLVNSSQDLVDRLKKKHSRNEALIKLLDSFTISARTVKDDVDTKNGGDCRAAVVVVQ